jgi:uncharacterized protein YjbI with pentapeptide repeats
VKRFISIFISIQLFMSVISLPDAEATACPTVSVEGIVSPALEPSGVYVGCFFAGANLSNSVIDSVTILNGDFSGANISNATIKNSSISDSDFTGALFSNSIFQDSTLSSLVLKNSNLQDASFSGITSNDLSGVPLNLRSMYKMVNGFLLSPYAKLDGINLSGVDLRGVFLTGASLKNSTFSNGLNAGLNLDYADLTNARIPFTAGTNLSLQYAKLTGANLQGADLRVARLSYVISGNIVNGPTFLPTGWRFLNGYLVGKYANLSNAQFNGTSFSGLDLYGVNWKESVLTNVNFTNADLRHADFRFSTITGATVTGANLYSASVYGLRTSGLLGVPSALSNSTDCVVGGFYFGYSVNLTNSDISNLNLYGCNLQGADITGSTVTGTKFWGMDKHARLRANDLVGTPHSTPTGISFRYQTFLGPEVDLSGADLHDKDLSSINLTGSKLDDCDLSGADFSGSNLTDSLIENSDLTDTNFDSATLTGVETSNLSGQPMNLPSGYETRYGFILGPGVKLYDASLNDLDFSQLNLSGAQLTGVDALGTNFSNSNLSGVMFWYGIFNGADFSSAIMSGSNIDHAEFTDSLFDNALAVDLVGTPKSLPRDWFLVEGKLFTVPARVNLPSVSNIDSTSITASWIQPAITDNTNNYRYDLRFRSSVIDSTWVVISDLSDTFKKITALSPGISYEVQVRASNQASEGAWSESREVETPNLLSILNTDLSNPADVQVSLISAGGLGNGEIRYSVEGDNCELTGATLFATAAVTCTVTARKDAQGIYAELLSASRTFIFRAVPQPSLEIVNQITRFPVSTELEIEIRGGSGSGVISYTVVGNGCRVELGILFADGPTQCQVTGKKVASGIYLEAISQPMMFEFFDLAKPAIIELLGLEDSGSKSLKFNDYIDFTVTTDATDYLITSDSKCTILNGRLTANFGNGFCVINVLVPAVKDIFTETIFTKQVKLGLAQIEISAVTAPKTGKSISLKKSYSVGAISASLKWVSTTKRICTVNAGKLKALKKGKCRIQVSSPGVLNYIAALSTRAMTLSIK